MTCQTCPLHGDPYARLSKADKDVASCMKVDGLNNKIVSGISNCDASDSDNMQVAPSMLAAR